MANKNTGRTSIREEISQIHTFRDLSAFLSPGRLERAAAGLLIWWCLAPAFLLAAGVAALRPDARDSWFSVSISSAFWQIFLQQVGILGCVAGLFCLLRSLAAARAGQVKPRAWLSAHLPELLLAAMLFWSLISALLSEYRETAFQGTDYRHEGFLTYLMYGGLFSLGHAVRNPRIVRAVLSVFTTVAALLAILAILDQEAVNQFFRITTTDSVFFNQNHFAYYLCLAVMTAAGLLVDEQRGIWLITGRAAVLAVLTVALVRNRSFGPFLASLVGFACLLAVMLARRNGLKRYWPALAIYGVSVIAANWSLGALGNDFRQLIIDAGSVIENPDEAAAAGSRRWELWQAGFRAIAEKPLFGYGPDSLGVRFLALGLENDRPHNEPIQFAASLGLPALAFYLSSLTVLLARFTKTLSRLPAVAVTLFCAAAAYLFSSLFGNSMFYTTPFFMMILSLLSAQISTASKPSGQTQSI